MGVCQFQTESVTRYAYGRPEHGHHSVVYLRKRMKADLTILFPDREEVNPSTLPEIFQEGYIGLAIGAQHMTKKLPLNSLIELCHTIKFPLIILGGPSDKDTSEAIIKALPEKSLLNGCGNYRINQSASLVRQSRVLITHDTGLMHMGAAFNRKIISIWGNTVPQFGMSPYKADPSSVQFEVPGLDCRPCSKIGHQTCPKKHFKCMLDQDLEGIGRAANQLFLTTARQKYT